MTSRTTHRQANAGREGGRASDVVLEADGQRPAPRLTSEQVWKAIARESFAVLSYVTPSGKPGSPLLRSLPKELTALLPAERRAEGSVVEIVPEGTFVTYGLGVSLMRMADPNAARSRVAVCGEGEPS